MAFEYIILELKTGTLTCMKCKLYLDNILTIVKLMFSFQSQAKYSTEVLDIIPEAFYHDFVLRSAYKEVMVSSHCI